MVFLPGDASADDVATITAAFKAATMVDGFGEASGYDGATAQVEVEGAIEVLRQHVVEL